MELEAAGRSEGQTAGPPVGFQQQQQSYCVTEEHLKFQGCGFDLGVNNSASP